MYEVKNVSRKPVFVEGVCLNYDESTKINSITKSVENLRKLNIIRINYIGDKTTEVITEEGTGSAIKKRRSKSSKILNE